MLIQACLRQKVQAERRMGDLTDPCGGCRLAVAPMEPAGKLLGGPCLVQHRQRRVGTQEVLQNAQCTGIHAL